MKIQFYSVVILMIFALCWSSCSSDLAGNMNKANPKDVLTNQTRAVEAEEGTKAFLAQNWVGENGTYITLKIDGTFEAVLEDGLTSVGSWQLSDDETQLTLTGEKDPKGKVRNIKDVYKLSEVDSDHLTLVSQGEAPVELSFSVE